MVKAMSIEEWIKLLADRSKYGNIGEYFHRRQCAEILEFLRKKRNLLFKTKEEAIEHANELLEVLRSDS